MKTGERRGDFLSPNRREENDYFNQSYEGRIKFMEFMDRIRQMLALRELGNLREDNIGEMDVDDGSEDFTEAFDLLSDDVVLAMKVTEDAEEISRLVTKLLNSKRADILELLQWILFMEEPTSSLQRMEEEHPPGRGVCGKVWEVNDIVVKCRDCELDSSSAICIDCFRMGDHNGHDVMFIRSGGGCCDCGNPQAWKPEGFCKSHPGPFRGVDPLLDLEEELRWKARVVLSTVIEHLTWLFVLHNGYEKGSIRKASTCLAHVKTILEFLSEVSKRSDAIHRIVCEEFLRDYEFSPAEAITNTDDVCYADRERWDTEGFMRKRQSRLYLTLFLSTGLPLDDRMSFYQFFFILISDNTFKFPFAVAFCSMYRSVISPSVDEQGERQYTSNLHAFSVQLFTVEELVPYLFKSVGLGDILMDFFLEFQTNCRKTDDYMNVIAAEDDNIRHKKYFNVLVDMQYSLTHINVSRVALYDMYPDFLDKWLDILVGFQGMNAIARAKYVHVEREQSQWVNAFNAELDVAYVSNLLRKGIYTPYEDSEDFIIRTPPPSKEMALKLINRVYNRCVDWIDDVRRRYSNSQDGSEPPPFAPTYSPEDNKVTWTIPMFRFLGMLVSDTTANWDVTLEDLHMPRYVDIVSYGFAIFSAQAQIFAQKWVRNGETLNVMARQYEGRVCSGRMFDLDIFLLQLHACVLRNLSGAGEIFFQQFVNSFGMKEKLFPLNDELATENLLDNVDLNNRGLHIYEFLRSVNHLICERYHSGKYTKRDIVRREMIHRLALGDTSHSRLDDTLPRGIYAEKYFEEILGEIADSKESATRDEVRYVLKEQLWGEFSAHFFHYSRSEAAEAEDGYFQHMKSLKPDLKVKIVPPPVHLAELKLPFKDLQLAICESRTLHRILYAIIHRSLISAFPVPATQLHVTLSILYYCVDLGSLKVTQEDLLENGSVVSILNNDTGGYAFEYPSDNFLINVQLPVSFDGVDVGELIKKKDANALSEVPQHSIGSSISLATMLALMMKSKADVYMQLHPLLRRIHRRLRLMGVKAELEGMKSGREISTNAKEEAALRQKRIMEMYMKRQANFSENFKSELEDLHETDGKEHSEEDALELFDCIHCRMELEDNSENAFVVLANVSRSSIARFAARNVQKKMYGGEPVLLAPNELVDPFHDANLPSLSTGNALRQFLRPKPEDESEASSRQRNMVPSLPAPPLLPQFMAGAALSEEMQSIVHHFDPTVEEMEEQMAESYMNQPEDTEKGFLEDIDIAMVSPDESNTCVAKSCWHAMHMSCFNSFYSYYLANNMSLFRSEGDPLEKRLGDFSCPLCRCVCNSMVPVLSRKRRDGNLLDSPLPPPYGDIPTTSVLFKQICTTTSKIIHLSLQRNHFRGATEPDSGKVEAAAERGHEPLAIVTLIASTLSNIEHAARALPQDANGVRDLSVQERVAAIVFPEADGTNLVCQENDLALARYILWNLWIYFNKSVEDSSAYAKVRMELFFKVRDFLSGVAEPGPMSLGLLAIDALSLAVFLVATLKVSDSSHIQEDMWLGGGLYEEEFDDIFRITGTMALTQALLSAWKSRCIPLSYPQINLGKTEDENQFNDCIEVAEELVEFCRNYNEETHEELLGLDNVVGLGLHMLLGPYMRRIGLLKLLLMHKPSKILLDKTAGSLVLPLPLAFNFDSVRTAVMIARAAMEAEFAFFKKLVPAVPMLLVNLPSRYQSLFSTIDMHCEICNKDRSSPAICLICGTVLCAGGNCSAISDMKPVSAHAHLHDGSCAFIFTKSAYYFLFYVRRDLKSSGSFFQALYIDKWGEEDRGLKRGRLMDIQAQRVEKLRKTLLQNEIQNEVTWSSVDSRLLLNVY